jgi:hypothetical protein
MEVAGLTVGIAGLAGLFTQCIECFELVQRGRYLGKDYLLLETKFANQRLRLLAWGRACGFWDATGYRLELNDDEIRSQLEQTLGHLINLFQDGKALRRKYGLNDGEAGPSNVPAISSAIEKYTPGATFLGLRLQELRDRIKRTQKQVSISNMARWAIEDKNKFNDLLGHIRDLISDLEDLTKPFGIMERQREEIKSEVGSIYDIPVLESIEEARVGSIDVVSDAASIRLWELRDQVQEGKLEGQEHIYEPHIAPKKPIRTATDEWEVLEKPSRTEPESTSRPGYRVIHLVYCKEVDTELKYLDAPNYSVWDDETDQWIRIHHNVSVGSQNYHLGGQRPVGDLQEYSAEHPNIPFFYIKKYTCCHNEGGRKKDVTPDDIRFHIASDAFSEELLNFMKGRPRCSVNHPRFIPQSEISEPYYWYHHDREAIHEDLETRECIDENSLLDLKAFFALIQEQYYLRHPQVNATIARRCILWSDLPCLYVNYPSFINLKHKFTDLSTAAGRDCCV